LFDIICIFAIMNIDYYDIKCKRQKNGLWGTPMALRKMESLPLSVDWLRINFHIFHHLFLPFYFVIFYYILYVISPFC